MTMKAKWMISVCLLLWASMDRTWAYDEHSQYEPFAPDGVPFCVADTAWDADGLGSHRAVVEVKETSLKAVRVLLRWRRPDRSPERKTIVVIYAATGKEAEHVYLESCNAEEGVAWFPSSGAGLYYLYYLPHPIIRGWDDFRYKPGWNSYTTYDAEAGQNWRNSLGDSKPAEGRVLRYEARNEHEFFSAMGNIATAEEMNALRTSHAENPIVFMEDRSFPARLTHRLPVRWVMNGPNTSYEGTALRNEYFVWQIGLWAAHGRLENVKVAFSDLKNEKSGEIIPSTAMTCFNQEGTNWDGTPLLFDVAVPEGDVQTLWCGVQVPENAAPGDYQGKVTMTAKNVKQQTMNVLIHVENKVLADKGDSELWRLARLRWLNSTIAQDSLPIAPYQAMRLKKNVIQATEKKVRIGTDGLARSIQVNGQEVLAAPVGLEIATANNDTIRFDKGTLKMKKQADGLVTWTSEQDKGGMRLQLEGRMEFDGYMHFQLGLSSLAGDTDVNDICLKTTYTTQSQTYMMGIGLPGGYRPETYKWKWEGPYDSYWIGGVEAGLHVEFRGGSYHGPLLNDYKPAPPAVWANEGKGAVSVNGTQEATVVASTGKTRLSTVPIHLEFAYNITPVKPVDTRKQFSMRFYHEGWSNFDKVAEETGANICNIHHTADLNPVINYPFIIQEPLRDFVRHEHKEGRKVKLYYTVRELTNHLPEIYALKSLGSEIIAPGVGEGTSWLCEHLIENYRPAWYTETSYPDLKDEAFVLTPNSRWLNYYVEGLRWMAENYGIDGIYMDDVSFDRTTVKRIRKVLERYGPQGGLIDLHSNTAYSRGPANQYTEFFPYMDRLWFGESFKYNELKPDEWLVTFSGIPFGPMSEMLQDGGNRYLGALFGATARYAGTHTAVPMWKLWKEFGIEEAQMIGWWDDQCPIIPSDDEVKATTYVRSDRVLVAIGNFANEPKTVTLDFNWKRLRMKPDKVRMIFPPVDDFQQEGTYSPGDAITINAKEGRLIIIEQI